MSLQFIWEQNASLRGGLRLERRAGVNLRFVEAHSSIINTRHHCLQKTCVFRSYCSGEQWNITTAVMFHQRLSLWNFCLRGNDHFHDQLQSVLSPGSPSPGHRVQWCLLNCLNQNEESWLVCQGWIYFFYISVWLLDLSSYSTCFLWDTGFCFGPTVFVDSGISGNVLQGSNLPLKPQTHWEYSVFWVIAFNPCHSLHLLLSGVAFWSGRRNFTRCGWKPPYFPSDNKCCAVRWSDYLQEHHQSFLLPHFHWQSPPHTLILPLGDCSPHRIISSHRSPQNTLSSHLPTLWFTEHN